MAECRRQTENLRQMYEQFANEKKKWEKEYESHKLKIEKEKDSLQEKQMDLKREKVWNVYYVICFFETRISNTGESCRTRGKTQRKATGAAGKTGPVLQELRDLIRRKG